MRFEWSYGPADVYTDEHLVDVVSGVHWYCTGFSDDGFSVKESGMINLAPPDATTFIPFSQINAIMVRTWVESKLDKNAVQARMLYEYNNRYNSGVKPFKF